MAKQLTRPVTVTLQVAQCGAIETAEDLREAVRYLIEDRTAKGEKLRVILLGKKERAILSKHYGLHLAPKHLQDLSIMWTDAASQLKVA